ncbi:hypothetical protein [Confluentibacter sediminis]|uniref:hypothetical protein n=1 Tax=Confluentibacter sediminis TaxID=2219045 RepID=UPI000DAD6C89|nr:hypothetical protein [Confluentibacter sediminis]
MKTATIILSLFMLFKPIIPFVEYVALYDYIKNELCINKDKPILKCNGKCFLKKQLAKASESENSKDKKHISVETSIVFFQPIKKDFCFRTLLHTIKLKTFSINGDLSYSYLGVNSIFRPPMV